MQSRSFVVVILLIILLCPVPAPGKSELPHEFGEQVPLYPSAQAVETRYTRDSVTAHFTTDDSYDRVFDFYAEALDAAGWLIIPTKSPGRLTAEKSEPGKEDIELTLTEASVQGRPSGFTIDLHYPGGRE